MLAYPEPGRPLIVDTDASNVEVGAVLSQEGDNRGYVIMYNSQAFNKAERSFVTCRGLLVVVRVLCHCQAIPLWEKVPAAD